MPELPEVENIVRDLRPKLCGKLIKEVEVAHHSIIVGRKNNLPGLLRNKKIKNLSRKGKCIVFDLSNGYELSIHLGMTGQLLYRQKGGAIDRHTRMVLHLNDNLHELRFADMRRFGWVSLRSKMRRGVRPGEDKNAYLDNLGPDALTLDLKGFKTCLSNRTGTVKGLLLNQHIISGLGNIYTDESLYRAGIHPQRKINTLTEHEIKRLHKAIGQILNEAIVCGGSSVSTYRLPDGKEGEFQRQHKVYKRQGRLCPRCRTPIVRIKVAGRGTCFCPKCQDEN
ncbi:MAG: bifunctional DNA-formamidopyrimidine glycosylase/DNA-(apurinic or apyrimidinic site) lyase [Desulfovibrionales bacterium]|nr:bifunctional DNA-formamidopyrimidine glycosylase/DNA-(apurinic or apyrimidinic site) lyase [Desulfovibrionales bacterium]